MDRMIPGMGGGECGGEMAAMVRAAGGVEVEDEDYGRV